MQGIPRTQGLFRGDSGGQFPRAVPIRSPPTVGLRSLAGPFPGLWIQFSLNYSGLVRVSWDVIVVSLHVCLILEEAELLTHLWLLYPLLFNACSCLLPFSPDIVCLILGVSLSFIYSIYQACGDQYMLQISFPTLRSICIFKVVFNLCQLVCFCHLKGSFPSRVRIRSWICLTTCPWGDKCKSEKSICTLSSLEKQASEEWESAVIHYLC